MDTKERIIAEAERLFKRYGIRSVTMDDVAKALGISKKTIYQFFADKGILVFSCVQKSVEEKEAQMHKINQEAGDAMEKMFMISGHIRAVLKEINPVLLYDLQKYYPRAWALHWKQSFGKTKKMLIQILEEGIAEGYVRKTIDTKILATMRLYQIEMGFNHLLFPPTDFDISAVQMSFFEHFLYGICTKKGYERVQMHIDSEGN